VADGGLAIRYYVTGQKGPVVLVDIAQLVGVKRQFDHYTVESFCS